MLPVYTAHDTTKKIWKKASWKCDYWFSSEVSKLTLVNCLFNDAFSYMKKEDFQQYCPLIVIILTKCIFHHVFIIHWGHNIFKRHILLQRINISMTNKSYFPPKLILTPQRKKAGIFSKCLFLQRILVISWAI